MIGSRLVPRTAATAVLGLVVLGLATDVAASDLPSIRAHRYDVILRKPSSPARADRQRLAVLQIPPMPGNTSHAEPGMQIIKTAVERVLAPAFGISGFWNHPDAEKNQQKSLYHERLLQSWKVPGWTVAVFGDKTPLGIIRMYMGPGDYLPPAAAQFLEEARRVLGENAQARLRDDPGDARRALERRGFRFDNLDEMRAIVNASANERPLVETGSLGISKRKRRHTRMAAFAVFCQALLMDVLPAQRGTLVVRTRLESGRVKLFEAAGFDLVGSFPTDSLLPRDQEGHPVGEPPHLALMTTGAGTFLAHQIGDLERLLGKPVEELMADPSKPISVEGVLEYKGKLDNWQKLLEPN